MSSLPSNIDGFIIEATQSRESTTQSEVWKVVGSESLDQAMAWVAVNAPDTKTAIDYRKLKKENTSSVMPTSTLSKIIISGEQVFSGFGGGHSPEGTPSFPSRPANSSRSLYQVRVNYVDLSAEIVFVWYTYQSQSVREYFKVAAVAAGTTADNMNDNTPVNTVPFIVGSRWNTSGDYIFLNEYERSSMPVPGLENSPYLAPEMDKDGNVSIHGIERTVYSPVLNVRAYLDEDWVKCRKKVTGLSGSNTYYAMLTRAMGRAHFPSGVTSGDTTTDIARAIRILDDQFKKVNPDAGYWEDGMAEPFAGHVLIGASEPIYNQDAGKMEVIYQFAQYDVAIRQYVVRNDDNTFSIVKQSTPESGHTFGLNGMAESWPGNIEPIPGAKYPYTIQAMTVNSFSFFDMAWLLSTPKNLENNSP